ncbi:pyridoxal phosphate-dependent transferase [Aspergillus californicus]
MGSIGSDAYLYQIVVKGHSPPIVKSAEGIYFTLENGQKVLDATGGAAVSAIGHGNKAVKDAIIRQLEAVTYAHNGFFQNTPAIELADWLVKSTGGQLSRACILNSGSEAVEAALKLAYQYFAELSPQSPRLNFISRRGSWHGCTIGALSVGDIKFKKTLFAPLLLKNVSQVSPCHPWRDMQEGETSEDYVNRLKQELEDEFQRLGPETVCGFIIEPMVGTALGCVPALPGYLRAMKEVCDRHGALLIFDEIMCGLGRTGIQHEWQREGVVPDIQTVGKVLGGGYAPVSALLIHDRVINGLERGSGMFLHTQTYQAQPITCAAALATQRYIEEHNLIENVRCMGEYLGEQLQLRLGAHPLVGDIRGRGLFWGVEMLKDKATKAPFNLDLNIAKRIRLRGLEKDYNICIFTATGAADGWTGDQLLLAPPFTVQTQDVDEIIRRVVVVLDSVWKDIEPAVRG